MMRFNQQRVKLPALPDAAANGECAERHAVITLAARNQMAALRLAPFNKILPGGLERGLDGLGAAAHEEDMAKSGRRMRDEVVREVFRDLRGEEAGVRVFELFKLRAHRRDDVTM